MDICFVEVFHVYPSGRFLVVTLLVQRESVFLILIDVTKLCFKKVMPVYTLKIIKYVLSRKKNNVFSDLCS